MKEIKASISCSQNSDNSNADISLTSHEGCSDLSVGATVKSENESGGEKKKTQEVGAEGNNAVPNIKFSPVLSFVVVASFSLLVGVGAYLIMKPIPDVEPNETYISCIAKVAICFASTIAAFLLSVKATASFFKLELLKGIINSSTSHELKKLYCDTLVEI
nr:hypothetical protein [Treponema sp.]